MPAELADVGLQLLLPAALAAGWLDAIGGGGGLIQLPALLLALPPQLTPLALGTNKISSIVGTTAAATTYWRRVPPPLRTTAPMTAAAFIASGFGSLMSSHLDPTRLRPAILLMLVLVFGLTLRNPTRQLRQVADHEVPEHGRLLPLLMGAGIGFYDGAIGPGTGSFLLIALVQLVGLSFLRASAAAKFVNIGTNLASVIVFGLAGHIWWQLGLLMGMANLLGGLLGSRMAVRFGSEFVRNLLLVAVGLLILKLGWSVFG